MGTEGWAFTEDAVIRVIKVIGSEAENMVSEIGVCIQEIVIYLKLMSNIIPSGDYPRFLNQVKHKGYTAV